MRTSIEISSVFCEFFKHLYISKVSYAGAELQLFLDSIVLPEISAVDREVLDQPLTLEKLQTTIANLPNIKSAGSDCLPSEIYKLYGTKLLPELLEIFNAALEYGHLPPFMNMVIIIVLLKLANVPNNPESYCPISLLTSDVKILAK